MADISIINDGNTDYNVKDAVCRSALAEVENKGAKNYIPPDVINSFSNVTLNNGTYTVDDGIVTVSINGSLTVTINAPSIEFVIKPGTYVFSASTNPQRDVTYNAYIYNDSASSVIARDDPNDSPGSVFTITQDTTVTLHLRVSKNYTGNTVVFKPMICTKAEWDISETFVPYGKTNPDLTAENTSQQTEINHAINTGSKNILNITELSRVHRGVTFTTNRDGSILISGATTGANSFFRLNVPQDSTAYANQVPIPKGKYKIFCVNPPVAEADRFVFTIGYRQTPNDTRKTKEANYTNGYKNELEITTDTGRIDATILSLSTAQGYSCTAYPMIYPYYITDQTFESYSMSNAQLTSEIGVYGVGKTINASSADGFDFDDLKTPGVYTIGLTALSYSVHAPRTDAVARVEVKYLNSESNIRQEFYPLVGTCSYYVRCYQQTYGWGSWYLFEGVEVT